MVAGVLALVAIVTVLGPGAAAPAMADPGCPEPSLCVVPPYFQSAANGLYVSAEQGYRGSNSRMLRARARDLGAWEAFAAAPMPNLSDGSTQCAYPPPAGWGCSGSIVIRSLDSRLYVSAELAYGGMYYGELRARATEIGPWELFDSYYLLGVAITQPDVHAYRSQANGLFVSTELNYRDSNYGMLRARATEIGPWERFYGVIW